MSDAKDEELQRLRGGISVRDALVTENAIRAAAAEAEVKRLREERDKFDDEAERLGERAAAAEIAWKAAEAENRRLTEGVAYVEGVLMRDPVDDTQRKFAALLLRALLADSPDGGGAK